MIGAKVQARIVDEFALRGGLYADLTTRAHGLVTDLVSGSGLQLYSITQRVKTRESLARKLSKPDKTYAKLSDVTDLSAIRITTYFNDDVDQVAKLVESHFEIDKANSSDKRFLEDPQRFGYASIHYIVEFNNERCRLPEYSRFASLKFEIQVRSILQHAWAEIEHDLGYKSEVGIPRDIRRRFARVAGLLELADNEFVEIRKELTSYEKNVSLTIEHHPENVGIDQLSLKALLATPSSTVRQLAETIAHEKNAKLVESDSDIMSRNIAGLTFVGITNVAQLEAAAKAKTDLVLRFADSWLIKDAHAELQDGIGIFYLSYVLAAEKGDRHQVVQYILARGMVNDEKAPIPLADRILNTFKEIVER